MTDMSFQKDLEEKPKGKPLAKRVFEELGKPLVVVGVVAVITGLVGVISSIFQGPWFFTEAGHAPGTLRYWLSAISVVLGTIGIFYEVFRSKPWKHPVLLFGISLLFASVLVLELGVLIGVEPARTILTHIGVVGIAPATVAILYGILPHTKWRLAVSWIAASGLALGLFPVFQMLFMNNGMCVAALSNTAPVPGQMNCVQFLHDSENMVFFLWIFVFLPLVMGWGLIASLKDYLARRRMEAFVSTHLKGRGERLSMSS